MAELIKAVKTASAKNNLGQESFELAAACCRDFYAPQIELLPVINGTHQRRRESEAPMSAIGEKPPSLPPESEKIARSDKSRPGDN